MTTYERAKSYVSKMPVSVSGQGGHAAAFEVAAVLVKGFSLALDEAAQLLGEWNANCQPPWTAGELAHKLRQAQAARRPDGYLLGAGEWRAADRREVPEAPKVAPLAYNEAALRKLAGERRVDVGWLANRSAVDPATLDSEGFLRLMFRQGERVIVLADDRTQGSVWPDEPLPVVGPRGMWFLIQPVDGEMRVIERTGKKSRRSAESVTAWRYALFETDSAPAGLWMSAMVTLELPVAAVYTSGGRSLHILIKVDAGSQEDWRRLMDPLKAVMGAVGLDTKALTAVRLSRLPGQPRAEKGGFQRLLYVNPFPLCEAMVNRSPRRDVHADWMAEAKEAWMSQEVARMERALVALEFYGRAWPDMAEAAKDLWEGLEAVRGGAGGLPPARPGPAPA